MSLIDVIKIILPLLFILGLLWGALYLVRKYSFTLPASKNKLLNIKVISSQMLMPKKYITVVKINNSVLLLGVSEHSISLLKELDVTYTDEEIKEHQNQSSGLLDLMKKNLGLK